jgi:S-(hydroxymethyl)glutathione dehydrogenase / alcohol dehydrogenase
VGGAQVLRDFPRFLKLAETGKLDLGSLVSRRITLDQINDGIDALTPRRGRPHGHRLTSAGSPAERVRIR